MSLGITADDKEELRRLFDRGGYYGGDGYEFLADMARELIKDVRTPGRLEGVAWYTGFHGGITDDEGHYGHGHFHLLRALANRDYDLLPNTPTGWNDRFFLAHFIRGLGQQRETESAVKLVANGMAGFFEWVTERGFKLENHLAAFTRIRPDLNYQRTYGVSDPSQLPDDFDSEKEPHSLYFLNSDDIHQIAHFCKLTPEHLAEAAKFVLSHRSLGLSDEREDALVRFLIPSPEITSLVQRLQSERDFRRDIEEMNRRLSEWDGSARVAFDNLQI